MEILLKIWYAIPLFIVHLVILQQGRLAHITKLEYNGPETTGIGNTYLSRDVDPTPKKTNTPVLWLTSCETRDDKPIRWWDQAKLFQENSAKGPHPVDVRITNFCKGRKWHGFLTKDVHMVQFLANHTMTMADNTHVLFSDSDALLNVWSVPHASILLDRFHDITSVGGQSLVVGGEPNCWLGRFCKEKEMRLVYPDVHNKTSCPVFLNSGLFMGKAKTVMEMINTLRIDPNQNKEEDPSSKYLEMVRNILNHGERNHGSNQLRMAAFYAVNRDKVILDMRGSLFRNLYFGAIDSTVMRNKTDKKEEPASCGPNGILTCGHFQPAISGQVNTTSLEIIMDPVPHCPTESRPVFIHGNGKSGATLERLDAQLRAAVEAANGQG